MFAVLCITSLAFSLKDLLSLSEPEFIENSDYDLKFGGFDLKGPS